MNRNRLAICDPEQEYAYRLMDALSHREEFPFEIFTFTSTQKLRECLTDRPAEFLILPETAFHADMEGRLASKILLLWDTDGEHCPDLPGISKYSGVTKIMKKIMETASQNGSVSFLPAVQTDHSVRFLGIYTPVSRCLQTTFAFTIGQLLARNHKVLYLNFECYSGLSKVLERNFESDFSDLLYFLQSSQGEFLARLYRNVESINGMDMIPSAFSGFDIFRMEGEEWVRLMELLQMSRYDYVILDLSDGVQGLFEILRRCNRIYTIVREDSFAQAKLEQYRQLLKKADCTDVTDRTREVLLPVFQKLPRDLNHLTGSELAEFTERILQKDEPDRV